MLTTVLLAMTLAAATDTLEISDKTYELDPIIVVGQRQAVRLSKTVNSAISYSPEQIRRTDRGNILDLLSSNNASVLTTGVSGIGYGLGPAGQGKLLIRGLGFAPNRGTLVLTDGRPEIAGLFGHPLPDTYRKAGIYSAELVKGGASTLYGSNALAGVLDMTSFYRPDLDRYTNFELNGGSFDTFNGLVQHSQRFGKAIVAGWYEYLESDNYRPDNEYLNRSGGFRVQLDEISNIDFFMSGKYTSFDFVDPGPIYAPLRSSGDIQRYGLTIGADRQTQQLALSLRLYHSYGEHAFSDGFNSVDRNNGLDLFGRRDFDLGATRLSISGGGSVSYFGGSAHNGTPLIKAGNFHEYEYAAHLQTEINWRETLTLTVGGRQIEHDRFGGHVVYQTGLVISPDRYGSLKLTAGTAYRNPTIAELNLLPPGNSELQPEEGLFYELGYFNKLSNAFSVETAVFWREGENLIEVVPNNSPPPTFRNAGSYSHSGWEATVRFASAHWSISPSFIHLNQDSYNGSVPEDRTTLSSIFTKDRWDLNLDARASFATSSDSSFAIQGPPFTGSVDVVLDDYFVVDLGASYSLTDLLSLKLRMENLFDAAYQTVSGYPMPGLSLRVGVGVRMY